MDGVLVEGGKRDEEGVGEKALEGSWKELKQKLREFLDGSLALGAGQGPPFDTQTAQAHAKVATLGYSS